MIRTIDHLASEVHLLRIENEGLRQTVKIEKKRHKRGKPLFEQLRDEDNQLAQFYSPNKIQKARDAQAARIEQQQQEEARKADEKLQKELQKEERERMATQRKAEVQQARTERAIEKAHKAAEVQERKKQRAINQQLQFEAKQAKRAARSKAKQTDRLEEGAIVDQVVETVEVVKLATTSRGRSIRQPQHLKDYEL